MAVAAFVALGLSVTTAGASEATTCSANVSMYGVLADGRLTYTTIQPSTGDRLQVILSTAELGFTAKAMAALNANTLLVTDASTGELWRVDIITNTVSSGLTFSKTKIGTRGWTHDDLTFDGSRLYGIAGGVLITYPISSSKPTSVSGGTRVSSGFTLKTLASASAGHIYGTTATGALLEYAINGTSWTRKVLVDTGWSNMRELASPGGGLIYGVTSPANGMYWYQQTSTGVTYHTSDPVDVSGWTQTIISAVPGGLCQGALDGNQLQTQFAATGGSYTTRSGSRYRVASNGCTTLTAWFVETHTDLTYGDGNGGVVVDRLKSRNPELIVSDRPQAGAIFSVTNFNDTWGAERHCGSGACGHTGLVLDFNPNNNRVTILETISTLNSAPYSRIRTLTWNPSQPVKFAYLDGHLH